MVDAESSEPRGCLEIVPWTHRVVSGTLRFDRKLVKNSIPFRQSEIFSVFYECVCLVAQGNRECIQVYELLWLGPCTTDSSRWLLDWP